MCSAHQITREKMAEEIEFFCAFNFIHWFNLNKKMIEIVECVTFKYENRNSFTALMLVIHSFKSYLIQNSVQFDTCPLQLANINSI